MSTATLAYRDSFEGARLRYADLVSHAWEERAVGPLVPRIMATRTGRIWAGATGIGQAALLAGTAIAAALSPTLDISPTRVLLAAWPTMGVAYLAGRIAGNRRAHRATLPPPTGDAHADLARLERAIRVDPARDQAARLEQYSTALPMAAFALLVPLTLHFVCAWVGDIGQKFDAWICISLAVVGHAHLALAAFLVDLARRVSKLSCAELLVERRRAGWRIYGYTVLVSAIPGLLLLLLPPILTAVTGLVFIPLMVWRVLGTVLAEREVLAA